MGYLNNVTGYRDDLLANRAIVKHGNFALLTPDGLVKNIIESGYDIEKVRFDVLSKLMQDEGDVIEAHELAKDGIVSQIYPLSGNEEAMGLDMLEQRL